VFHREGRRFEARRAGLQALEGFSRLKNQGKAALCHLLLGQLNLEAEDPDSAKAEAELALRLISGRKLPHILFQAHVLLGDICEYGQDLEKARASYSAAEEFLQHLRTQLSSTDLHIPFTESRLLVYDRLLNLATLLENSDDLPGLAFSLIERAKARTLSDLLGARATAIAPNRPTRSGLVEQVQGLREELRWYYKKMVQREMQPTQSPSSEPVPASLEEMEQKIVASLTEISKEDLEFGSLNQAFTLDLEEAQDLLTDDEAVLEYFVGDDVIHLVTVCRAGSTCLPIAISSEISELRRLLDFQLARRKSSTEATDKYQRAIDITKSCLSRLYEKLIAPVSDQIREYSKIKVIPHSFLAYLPFHAFVKEDHDLGDLFTVSYSPSVAALFFSRKRERVEEHATALVFEGGEGAQESTGPLLLSPWRAEVIPASAARLDWQARLRKGWNVIHVPLTIGFRLDNPVLSDVVISQAEITILDLFQLQLRADVVVVTDCGPEPSRLGSGDELLCLSRGLLYAGPRSVAMPLWKARSEAQQLVLKNFYLALNEGQPADVALQSGQRACKSEYPHPADWAPFTVYGP
jgi:CHAT domain-containing protein